MTEFKNQSAQITEECNKCCLLLLEVPVKHRSNELKSALNNHKLVSHKFHDIEWEIVKAKLADESLLLKSLEKEFKKIHSERNKAQKNLIKEFKKIKFVF